LQKKAPNVLKSHDAEMKLQSRPKARRRWLDQLDRGRTAFRRATRESLLGDAQ